jgi:hypothetical protein
MRHNIKELINAFHGVRMLRLGAVLTRNETPAFNGVMNPSHYTAWNERLMNDELEMVWKEAVVA